MRLLFSVLLLVLPLLAAADDVVDLSDQDSAGFKRELSKYDAALVEFFAPWCGHCKRLAPEYAVAASELKNNDPQVPLVKVDCTSDAGGKDLCSEYNVNGYPTLKIFKSGEFAADYNGPRDAAGIVKYMKSQVGPASREYSNYADLEKRLQATKEVVVVGLFSSDSDSLYKKFNKVADRLRESVSFAHVLSLPTGDEAVAAFPLKDVSGSSIVLVRPQALKNKFEANFVVYDEVSTLDDWINSNYHGLVGHRTQSNMADFKSPLILAYYDVDYIKNPKGTNYWRNRILKVAKENTDYTFAVSNANHFAGELDEFGVDSSKLTRDSAPVVVARDGDGKKYVLKDKFSVDTLNKFVADVQAGSLEAFIKSEDVPEDNSGPVKVAVGKNFDDLVMKTNKDVFIEFYAPWCGHCKKLAPTFEELGKALANDDGVEIVKMDATANDVPSPFVVHGFPTMFFLPAGTKSPKKYEGGRELNDFISYIAKHATNELSGYHRDGTAKKEDL